MTRERHKEELIRKLINVVGNDHDFEAVHDLCADDPLAIRGVSTGCHVGEFKGIPARDQDLSWAAHGFFRIAVARIAEAWRLSDTKGLMECLGTAPGGA